jgi:hypothetical protein
MNSVQKEKWVTAMKEEMNASMEKTCGIWLIF